MHLGTYSMLKQHYTLDDVGNYSQLSMFHKYTNCMHFMQLKYQFQRTNLQLQLYF